MGFFKNPARHTSRAGVYLYFLIFTLFSPYFLAGQPSNLSDIKALYNEAEKLRLNGNFERSIELFQESLATVNYDSKHDFILDIHFKLGLLFWNIGDINIAKSHFALVYENKRESKNSNKRYLSGKSINIIDLYIKGKKLRAEGKLLIAAKTFEEAIELSRNISIPDFEIKCTRLLSLTKWELSEFEQFHSLNMHNLKLSIESFNKREETIALNNLGAYYWKIAKYVDSLVSFQKARLKAKQFDFKQEISDASLNLGGLLADLGDYTKSLEYLQEAYEIDKLLGYKTNMAYDLNNLGYTTRLKAISDNDFSLLDKAREYFDQALKTAREAGVEYVEFYALLNLGTVYSLLNMYDKAIEYHLKAEEYAKKRKDEFFLGHINNNLGIIYARMGEETKSMERFDKAIEVASMNQTGAFAWETYLEIGNNLKKKGEYNESLENYEKAVSLIEDTRSEIVLEELKASYLGGDRRMDVYHNIIEALIRLHHASPNKGYDRKAFYYLEKGKARAFLDSLKVADIDIVKGIDPKLILRERNLTREISRAYTRLLTAGLSEEERESIIKQLKNAEEQLDALKREIRTTSPAYADLKYPSVLNYEQAKKLVSEDQTVLLAYSIGEDTSWCFKLSSNGLNIFELPGKDKIKEKVIAYRKSISDPDNQDFDAGHDLYLQLIPTDMELNIKKIVIIPDDILNLLPFEALLADLKPRRWLVENYILSYAPSVSALQVLEKRRSEGRPPRRTVLALGDAEYNHNAKDTEMHDIDVSIPAIGTWAGASLERLRYSGLEVGEVSRILKARKSDILLGEKATEDNIKTTDLVDYKIVHLAAHAFVDDKNPLRSSIVLTLDRDPAEDGLLQMREIYNLRMNADLVTLSACQTGLGHFIRGEGISGINRAFFYAGASSVCMSLWAVNDEATFQMMSRFYFHLKSGLSVNKALHRTKVEMIGSEALSHPYYWASFIVSGKADRKVFKKGSNPVFWLAVPFIIGLGSALTVRNLRAMKEKVILSQSPGSSFSNKR